MPTPTQTDSTTNTRPLQLATSLVDSVHNGLFTEISSGVLIVDDEQTPLRVQRELKRIRSKEGEDAQDPSHRRRSKVVISQEEMEEHRRNVRRFMSQNRKIKRQREMRSIQISERSIRLQQTEDKSKQQLRAKLLQQRRQQIQKRMQAKRTLMQQIRQSTLQCNSQTPKTRVLLYEKNEQQFYKNTILPKIAEQNKFLQQRRAYMRKPMNMTELFQHEKNYQSLRINSRINRSLTISVIKEKGREYRPPEYVSEAYKRSLEEQERVKKEEQQKKRQIEENQTRKREFVKKLQEMREKERQLERSKEKQHTPQKIVEQKAKKPQLDRQQTKNLGNQYLKQLLQKARRSKKPPNLLPLQTPQYPPHTPSTHSHLQIKIIHQHRTEQIHKLRNRKITELLANNKIDPHTKQERLQYEIERLDLEVQRKMGSADLDVVNQGALVMVSSIQAKLGMLGVGGGSDGGKEGE